MKKTVLAVALVAAAGSVAAQTATPPSVSPGTVTPPSVGSGVVTTPPVKPPAAATPGVTPPSIATTPPASGGGVGVAGEAQARARIERDGFTNVTGLTKGTDGTWRGTAMRGSTSVQVTIDARGTVTTQ